MIDGVSILVVSRGRVKLLEELFKSLESARKECSLPTELLIVDNSDSDDAKAIEELCKAYDARYYYEASSVAIKRNRCAELAKYELLYYCDSDCIVTPNVINEHLIMYEDASVGAVSGPVILEGRENPLVKTLSETSWCNCFTQPMKHPELEWGTTANFSVLRDVFYRAGGFNTRFPNKPGGEDVDIGFRIRNVGYVIKSAPDATVYHSNKTWLSFKEVSSRLFSYGRSNVLVAISHPDRLIADINWVAILLLVSLFSLILTFVVGFIALIVPPVMFITYILVSSFEKMILSKQALWKVLLVELLSVFESFGTLAGCVKYKTLKPLYRQVMYSKFQEHGTFPDNQIKYLNLFLSLVICCVLVLI